MRKTTQEGQSVEDNGTIEHSANCYNSDRCSGSGGDAKSEIKQLADTFWLSPRQDPAGCVRHLQGKETRVIWGFLKCLRDGAISSTSWVRSSTTVQLWGRWMHRIKPLSYIHLTAGKVNLFVKMFCFKHPLGMNIGKCMFKKKNKNTTNLSQVILVQASITRPY